MPIGSPACLLAIKCPKMCSIMQMDQITDRFPGVIAIHDDICVFGKDTTEHDHNLL